MQIQSGVDEKQRRSKRKRGAPVGNLNALNLLLEYNKEDVLNLITLEKILDEMRGDLS